MELAPSLYGAIASLFSPILYSILISYLNPEHFDWREFLRIDLVEDETTLSIGGASSPDGSIAALSTGEDGKQREKTSVVSAIDEGPQQNPVVQGSATPLADLVHPLDEETLRHLRRWYKIAWVFLIFIVAITFVVWPMPLYRDYIFTKPFFRGWMSVAIFWQFFALFAVVIYPVYDGRHEIAKSVRGVGTSLGKCFQS